MGFDDQRARGILLWLLMLMAQSGCASADETESPREATSDPSGVVDVVQLDEEELNESSGLALSTREPGHFWTHNDSGSKARLYAFDSQGRRTAKRKLSSTSANDWEDMCGFVQGGQPYLLIADCGDNSRGRDSISLYLMEEPDPHGSESIKDVRLIKVRYPDGSHDCEAVAVDPVRRQIVLVTKTFLPNCGIYVIPLPDCDELPPRQEMVAERVGGLPIPMVTAMDIDPISGDVWLVSYFQAFQFKADEREVDLARQMKELPIAHELPRWRQIEAVAIDSQQDVWVTSEGRPAPLGRLPQGTADADATQTPSRPQ